MANEQYFSRMPVPTANWISTKIFFVAVIYFKHLQGIKKFKNVNIFKIQVFFKRNFETRNINGESVTLYKWCNLTSTTFKWFQYYRHANKSRIFIMQLNLKSILLILQSQTLLPSCLPKSVRRCQFAVLTVFVFQGPHTAEIGSRSVAARTKPVKWPR